MRLAKKLYASCLLTLALALPVLAGDMSAGVIKETPVGDAALDLATSALLSLLQSLTALF